MNIKEYIAKEENTSPIEAKYNLYVIGQAPDKLGDILKKDTPFGLVYLAKSMGDEFIFISTAQAVREINYRYGVKCNIIQETDYDQYENPDRTLLITDKDGFILPL